MKYKFKIEIRSGYVVGDVWYVVYIREGNFFRRRWEILKTFLKKEDAINFIKENKQLEL